MPNKPHTASQFLANDPKLDILNRKLDALNHLLTLVRSALPKDSAGHCLCAVPHGRRLHLVVSSSAWGSRIRYYRAPILQSLSAAGWRFDDLKLRIASPEPGPPRRPKRRAAVPSATALRTIFETADSVPDPELEQALRRLGRAAAGGGEETE